MGAAVKTNTGENWFTITRAYGGPKVRVRDSVNGRTKWYEVTSVSAHPETGTLIFRGYRYRPTTGVTFGANPVVIPARRIDLAQP